MSAPEAAVAEVVRVEPGRATRTVVIRCPYCWELHSHGWPDGMADIGPRVAHCHPRPAGGARSYCIPTPGGDVA